MRVSREFGTFVVRIAEVPVSPHNRKRRKLKFRLRWTRTNLRRLDEGDVAEGGKDGGAHEKPRGIPTPTPTNVDRRDATFRRTHLDFKMLRCMI